MWILGSPLVWDPQPIPKYETILPYSKNSDVDDNHWWWWHGLEIWSTVLNTEAAVQQRFSLSPETRKSDVCGFQASKKSGWNFCSLWSRASLALNAAVALLEKSPQLVAENPFPCFQWEVLQPPPAGSLRDSFLAAQGAQEVMWVIESVSPSLTSRLDWCDSGEWGCLLDTWLMLLWWVRMTSDESYLEMKIYPVMKVIVVREVITCELHNDKNFTQLKMLKS